MAKKRQRWIPAYIGLGSNLSEPEHQIQVAVELLDRIPDSRLISRSPLYRSAPFGGIEQPDFVNAVAAMMTRLSVHDLLAELQRIETARGRVRDGVRWGPRVIDLDLLVYSDKRVEDAELTVPHPGIADRNFVLLPLRDVAPGLTIPGLGSIQCLEASCDEPAIERIE